jgi:serine/threonine protein kinase
MRYKNRTIKKKKMYNNKIINFRVRKTVNNNVKNKTKRIRLKKINGRSLDGSGAIAAGGYGCVFRPALKCKGSSKRKSGISKLMLSKYAEDEFNEIEKLKKTLINIKNNDKYFIISGIEICNPEKLESSDLENFDNKCSNLIKKGINAENINNNLNKVKILNSVDGGMDLSDYLNKYPLTYRMFIELNNKIISLLLNAVIKMNELKLYHFDIKSSNILIDKSKNIRIIDWGLSQKQKGNEVPSLIMRRPFQFNIPISVIILGDEFNNFIKAEIKKLNITQLNKLSVRPLIHNWILYFLKNYGHGHINYITYILELLFNENINITNQTIINRLRDKNNTDIPQEFSDYYYFINILTDYLIDIYLNFYENGDFNSKKYFNEVFGRNVDVFGLISVYFDILEIISPSTKYSQINKLSSNISNSLRLSLKNIIYRYCYSNYYASKPIDIENLVTDLKKLNTLK